MRFSGGVPNNGRGTLEVPRCAVERDRKEGALGASQGGFVESVISRYGIDAESEFPAWQSADLGPRRNNRLVA